MCQRRKRGEIKIERYRGREQEEERKKAKRKETRFLPSIGPIRLLLKKISSIRFQSHDSGQSRLALIWQR